jgi:hypothetical protein
MRLTWGGARFALPSLGHGGDGRCRAGSTFWLGDHSPEIAKPAGEAGRAYRQGPGELISGKSVFSHLSVFCKTFLATGGLVPISGQLGGLLRNLTEHS